MVAELAKKGCDLLTPVGFEEKIARNAFIEQKDQFVDGCVGVRDRDGDFSAESGVRAVERLCGRQQSFTAIVAANDTTAFGARLALYRRNVRVPDDVSIVGFDDQAEAAFMAPPLTTIRQPGREMGAMASRALLDLIDGKPFRSQPLKGELQLRESVGTVPAG